MLPEILAAAADLQRFCIAREWKFCFIGGLAIQRWGEPRFTHDADLTLLTGFGEERRYIDPLLANFAGRRADAAEFAERNRVLLLIHPNGIPLDVAMGAFPFEEASIARSTLWSPLPECELRICCAEDLIVHKAFAGRDGDWQDIRGILDRQGSKLDLPLIESELTPLLALKEAPENLDRLRQLISRHIG
jgi:hypothetical protein